MVILLRSFQSGAYAIVLILILAGVGVAWGARTLAEASARSEGIVVDWERMTLDDLDSVRVWIRNVGEHEVHGTPQILVLNENGGVQQSFAFGKFVISLDPEESVYVDWSLGPSQRCVYGMMDAGGAPADVRYRCHEPMTGEPPTSGSPCYACYGTAKFQGRFILVGVFGDEADAAVIDLS